MRKYEPSVILQALFTPIYVVVFVLVVLMYVAICVPPAIIEIIENFRRCKNG